MTVPSLTGYEESANKDKDLLLGRLFWYHVSEDCLKKHSDFVQELKDIGLDKNLPKEPKNHDTFRRVCTDAQVSRKPVANQPEVFENYMLREVAGAGDKIITRRVVCEKVDKKGKRLDYAQLADVEFNRETNHIDVTWINGYDATTHPAAQTITEYVRNTFIAQNGWLTHYGVRQWIRQSLQGFGATAVRPSGGIYFLPEHMADTVDKLEQMVSSLPGTTELHSLPLVDNDKQRAMVKRAFEAETIGACDDLISELHEIRAKGDGLTNEKMVRLMLERKKMNLKVAEYENLLDQNMKEAKARIEILDMELNLIQPLARKHKRGRPRKNGGTDVDATSADTVDATEIGDVQTGTANDTP